MTERKQYSAEEKFLILKEAEEGLKKLKTETKSIESVKRILM